MEIKTMSSRETTSAPNYWAIYLAPLFLEATYNGDVLYHELKNYNNYL